MKKITISAILLVALMGLNSVSFAQRDADRKVHAEVKVLAGGSIGDYGKYTNFNNSIYNTPEKTEAGAGFTGGFGIKVAFGLPVRNLALFVDADLLISATNKDLRKEFDDGSISGTPGVTDYYNSTPVPINLPIMGGVRYDIDFNHNYGMFIEGGLGVNFGAITPITYNFTYTSGSTKTTVNASLDHHTNITFAFQAGLGFNLGQRIRLGVSYFNLGTNNTTWDATVKTTTKVGSSTSTTSDTQKDIKGGKCNPQMIMGTLAIVF